ncbi:MAG: glycosyltransferase family 4 protein [Bdellovibrionales bacterium]
MQNRTTPVVMQIIPELGTGGAEQGCIDIADALVQAGARAIVVSNGGSRLHELARTGATHIDLPVHSKNPLVMWQNIRRIRRIINEHKVDIVHVRSRAPAWSALKACEGTNAHYMTTCHNPYNFHNSAKKFYNSAMTKGERVIAISHHVAQYMHEHYGLDERTMRLIPRGIPMDRFHPSLVTSERLVKLTKEWRIPEGKNIIMLPGRLTRWKGHSDLIEAISIIKRKDVFGLIIGPDKGHTEYRTELENLIREKGLESSIRMVDQCNDMPAAYMLASVAVCPSTSPEGFGRVPVEAQAMGRPIVATNHGGAMETIIHGETGWLVPVNSPQRLAQAIEEALSLTPEQRALLATRAMHHVAENFTKDLMASRTLDVYAELLR